MKTWYPVIPKKLAQFCCDNHEVMSGWSCNFLSNHSAVIFVTETTVGSLKVNNRHESSYILRNSRRKPVETLRNTNNFKTMMTILWMICDYHRPLLHYSRVMVVYHNDIPTIFQKTIIFPEKFCGWWLSPLKPGDTTAGRRVACDGTCPGDESSSLPGGQPWWRSRNMVQKWWMNGWLRKMVENVCLING